jgi:hypothetical protein
MENGSANGSGGERAGGKPRLVWLEILELIAAAMSFNFEKFKDEPFSVSYRLGFPGGRIEARVRNTRRSISPPPPMAGAGAIPGGNGTRTIRGRQESERFQYFADLRVTVDAPPFEWHVEANAVALQVQAASGASMTAPFPSATVLGSDFLWSALQLMQGTSAVDAYRVFGHAAIAWSELQRLDEALDFFSAMTSDKTWLEVTRPHGDFAGSTPGPTVSSNLVPPSLLEVIMIELAQRPFDDGGESLSVSQQHVGFLARASAILDFKTIRVDVRLLERRTVAGQDRLRFGDVRFTFERHDGSIITHGQLSYGQKRMLAFLYYLAMHPDTVVADELVDGLHHRWIEDSLDAIGDRQAFLASQNPLLLDHLEFDSADKVASTFITCRSERDADNKKHMIWCNMPAYDAERFFRAYQVDVQHVSEILLSKGLW